MELKSLNCPKCGGSLDYEDGIDVFFCKYCGNKIILSGQSDAAYWAKVKGKEYEYKQEVQKMHYQNEKAKIDVDYAEKKHNYIVQYGAYILLIILFIAMFVWLSSSSFMSTSGSEDHAARIEELEDLSLSIEEEISAGNYDQALLMTNRLRLNDGWSSSETAEWDERREGYIRIIYQAQGIEYVEETTETTAQPSIDPENMISVPLNSYSCREYTRTELMEIFTEAGFENVNSERVPGGRFNPFVGEDSVLLVKIDDSSVFQRGDLYEPNVDILIQYYE